MQKWNSLDKSDAEKKLFPRLFRSNSGVVLNPVQAKPNTHEPRLFDEIRSTTETNETLEQRLHRERKLRSAVEQQVRHGFPRPATCYMFARQSFNCKRKQS